MFAQLERYYGHIIAGGRKSAPTMNEARRDLRKAFEAIERARSIV